MGSRIENPAVPAASLDAVLSVPCSLTKKRVIEFFPATITELIGTTSQALFWLAGPVPSAKTKEIRQETSHVFLIPPQPTNNSSALVASFVF
jgi:hypothetical protein